MVIFGCRREDYQKKDVENWSKFVSEQKSNWKRAFVYFKHEESGSARNWRSK